MAQASYRLTRFVMVTAVLLPAILIIAGGCGPNHKARGTVKGKVTVGKTHLTAGTVVFTNQQGVTGTGVIDTEGNYIVYDAPVGECSVTVTVPTVPSDPSVRARMKGAGPKMPEMKGPPDGGGDVVAPPLAKVPKTIVQIDSKYNNKDTSGLKFTVEKGVEHEYNITL